MYFCCKGRSFADVCFQLSFLKRLCCLSVSKKSSIKSQAGENLRTVRCASEIESQWEGHGGRVCASVVFLGEFVGGFVECIMFGILERNAVQLILHIFADLFVLNLVYNYLQKKKKKTCLMPLGLTQRT